MSEAVDRSQLIIEHRTIGIRLAQRLLARWQMKLCSDELTSLVDLSLCEAAAQFREDRGAQFSTFLFYYIRGNIVQFVEKSVATKHLTALPEDDRYLSDESDTPEQTALRAEQRKLIRDFCNTLPTEEREILEQRFLKEHSRRTVAKHLDMNVAHLVRVERSILSKLRSYANESFDGLKAKPIEPTPAVPVAISQRSRRRRTLRLRVNQHFAPWRPLLSGVNRAA